MNSKTAFRNTFKLLNSEKPVFIPFVYSLAARLAQLSLEEMTSDASYYAHSLEDAGELFKYDGIINNYDSSIEAGLCGCEVEWYDDYISPRVTGYSQLELNEVNPEENVRFQVLLETTKRIAMSRGKDVAVIGVLTGPCSLAKTLAGDNTSGIEGMIPQVGSLLVRLVKSICELRVDAVFFREDMLESGYRDELRAYRKTYTDVYMTLFNLVRYYNCSPVIIVKNITLEDEAESRFNVVNQFVQGHKPTGFFYVSEGEVPYDTPSEALHSLIAKMKNA